MGNRFRMAAVAAVVLAAAGAASAQPFPSKPVHILVPYPPGGGVDVPDAHPGRCRVKAMGTIDRGREPPGGGRGDRVAGDRDLAARRL